MAGRVVIAIGTNDDLFESDKQWVPPAEFKRNLETIIANVTPLCDDVVLVGNPACDETKTRPVIWGDFHYTNAELERSERTIAAVAAKRKLPYVPLFDDFKAQLDNGKDLLADGLHPNAAGHTFIYKQVFDVLKRTVL